MSLALIVLLLAVHSAVSQDCAVPGHYCMDDAACCGGCCRNNACIMMYGPCYDYENLCESHSCPPAMECYIYQPDCTGCGPSAACRSWIK